MTNLKTRCIGALLVALIIGLMLVHQYSLYFCYLFLGIFMILELGNTLKINSGIAIGFHALSLCLAIWKGEKGLFYWIILLLSITIVRSVIVSSRIKNLQSSLSKIKKDLFINLYITTFFMPILFLSRKMIVLLLLLSFGTDTFAYFIGCLFGKHKLCPSISPNKSIEGAIGGVVGATLLGSVWGYFLITPSRVGFYTFLPILSILSQFGDLFASIIKRKQGIKDYSNLIPGHGGVLDRFDSVVFISSILYLCYHFTV